MLYGLFRNVNLDLNIIMLSNLEWIQQFLLLLYPQFTLFSFLQAPETAGRKQTSSKISI